MTRAGTNQTGNETLAVGAHGPDGLFGLPGRYGLPGHCGPRGRLADQTVTR